MAWYDITGSFSDLIMAGAAAYAAWHARSWFKQNTQTIGLKKAESIISFIDTYPIILNERVNKLALASLYILGREFDNIERLKEEIVIADNECAEIILYKNNLVKLKEEMNSLERWNVQFVTKDAFDKQLNEIEGVLNSASNANLSLRSALDAHISSDEYVSFFTKQFQTAYTDTVNDFAEFEMSYKKFLKLKFMDLFSTL